MKTMETLKAGRAWGNVPYVLKDIDASPDYLSNITVCYS